MNLRILRLITRLNIGGPARQALLLTRALRFSHPTLLAAGTPAENEGELQDPDVEVTRLPLVRPLAPATDLLALRATRALLRAHRPAVVHTHMAKAGAIGRTAARTVWPHPRTVHTFHGHVLEGYFSPAAQAVFLRAERQLARMTDVLVAISPEIRDSLLDLGVGRPEQYRLIPLGFDLTAHLEVAGHTGALRRKLGLDDHTLLVGALGRFAPVKNYDLVLQVAQRVPEAHFVILGDGESRVELERAAQAMGLSGRMHMPGWWSDVPSALADLDLVVLTSHNEGTPVTLIEAAAAGRAVVATDVGGVRFVVGHDRTGLVCAPGQADELAGAVRTLLQDPDRRSRMGRAGRAGARDGFGHERLIADIVALYDELTH